MPLFIIEQDITKINCDAIVNAANSSLLGGGGVDGAIHRAAGPLLLEECKTLGGCNTGDAKITKGYNLPAKYVIHTVGPIWRGGNNNEKSLLSSCYEKSLSLAEKHDCKTIAFPLISSGVYKYPKDQALHVAQDVISKFLKTHEMTVYITIFSKRDFEIYPDIYKGILNYLEYQLPDYSSRMNRLKCCKILGENDADDFTYYAPIHTYGSSTSYESDIEILLKSLDDTFAVTLLKLIDKKGLSDVECYKRANVSKQTWFKIMNEKTYRPSKNTVIAFAIALELTLDEAEILLKTVGFSLSNSNKFDIIIRYFLEREFYDIFVINETLFKFDQVCLGV